MENYRKMRNETSTSIEEPIDEVRIHFWTFGILIP